MTTACFALSGLLIGRVLLRLSEHPSLIAWWSFMLRRWGRTLPLYAAVVLTLAVFMPPVAPTGWSALDALARQLLLLQSMLPCGSGAYVPGLPQAWSLAVEEWFYLAFSVSMLGACRLFGQRAIAPVLAAFIVAPLVARIAGVWPEGGYFATLGNFDSITAGVALAAIERTKGFQRLTSRVALSLGAALVIIAWMPWWMDPKGIIDMPAWTPTLSSLGFCLMLIVALRLRSLGRLHGVVGYLSAQSYGIYLVHQPVLNAARGLVMDGTIGLPLAALIAVAGTAMLVWVGHVLVERPAMLLRPRQVYGSPTPASQPPHQVPRAGSGAVCAG